MGPGLRRDDDFIGYAFYISYVFVIFVPCGLIGDEK